MVTNDKFKYFCCFLYSLVFAVTFSSCAHIATAPLEIEKGTLTVTSEPSGATVWLDNVREGVTPFVIHTPSPGIVELISMKKGYKKFTDKVRVVDSGNRKIHILMEKKIVSGTLSVLISPTDARIHLKNSNKSYYKGMSLPSGTYYIEITKEGYVTMNTDVKIRSGQMTQISLRMIERIKKGTLTIVAEPVDAKIQITNIQPAYYNGIELKAGKYTIKVSKAGYKTKTEHILLKNGEMKRHIIILDRDQKPTNVTDKIYTEPLTNMEFVFVKGGCYEMGSPKSDPDYSYFELEHTVCVSDFWIAKYEVTNQQFRLFRPNHTLEAYKGHSLNENNQPAGNISWKEAQKYCKWLTEKSAFEYRLPTEAEWEYAARGGTTSSRFWGDFPDKSCTYANVHDSTSKKSFPHFTKNSHHCSDGYSGSAPVGSFKANPYGLYDMLGNVLEWCSDWYDERYYRQSPTANPIGPGFGSGRTVRGGAWNNSATFIRVTDRGGCRYNEHDQYNGFRIVRTSGK